jgi:hypothetical protein
MDDRASQQLAKMSDFLANTRSFQVEGLSSLDVVLEDGQKAQYNARSVVDVSRPYLKSRRVGPFADVLFLYDGQRFMLYDRARNLYAVSDAPRVTVNGITYQQCGSTYYRPYYQGSELVYVVETP